MDDGTHGVGLRCGDRVVSGRTALSRGASRAGRNGEGVEAGIGRVAAPVSWTPPRRRAASPSCRTSGRFAAGADARIDDGFGRIGRLPDSTCREGRG